MEPTNSLSLNRKLKHSLCLICCIHRRHRCHHQERLLSNETLAFTNLKPPSTSVSSAYAMQPKPSCKLGVPEIKDKCKRYLMSRIGRHNHRRNSLADFRYDATSYALNFDDGADDRFELRLKVTSAEKSNR
ncbi:Peptidylprolyl isomerase [Psidium guajava]|nr:Peptidylprolyl isomerase [Psidium guajava]